MSKKKTTKRQSKKTTKTTTKSTASIATDDEESNETIQESESLETQQKQQIGETMGKVSSRLREITNPQNLKLEKKPIPDTLVENEGIRYYFYFLYAFVALSLLTNINTNLINLQSLLDLGGPFYDPANNPLIPANLFNLFPLNFYSFFLALLLMLVRVFVATGLAIIAFDEQKDPWIRLVSVIGIVFIIFGVQLIGP